MTKLSTVDFTIEFTETVDASKMKYPNLMRVHESVERFRALADPAYEPVAIIETITTTEITTTSRRHPLGATKEQVIDRVRQRLLELPPALMPQGNAAFDWIATEVMKELGNG